MDDQELKAIFQRIKKLIKDNEYHSLEEGDIIEMLSKYPGWNRDIIQQALLQLRLEQRVYEEAPGKINIL